ncbi:hypothetical protein DBT_2340 [Dissulfuribacter thermophilus]|uniref:Nucleotidyl transferase AbiEii toxin, Type IV TA system n=1 Tax=Dissulfuribacter thermophilus TaxID=1156395 RepID=A0A1B9F2V0_9BACT|nr:hypothetical protein DBT_2340 [Dissulfuribacter thermophilus]
MELTKRLLTLACDIQTVAPAFILGGGTAVMFRYHHWESTDFDFFFRK